MRTTPLLTVMALAAALVVGAPPDARGQRLPGARGDLAGSPGVTPAEVQRLFDAYFVMQAQETLRLTDAQFPQFLPRVKALQAARQRGQLQRLRIVNELRQLLRPPDDSSEDAQIRDRLKTLQEADAGTEVEVRKAYDALAQILDTRQQARFRLFEEQMERRKIELLMRARQRNRLQNRDDPLLPN